MNPVIQKQMWVTEVEGNLYLDFDEGAARHRMAGALALGFIASRRLVPECEMNAALTALEESEARRLLRGGKN